MNQTILDYLESQDEAMNYIGYQLVMKEGLEAVNLYYNHVCHLFITQPVNGDLRWRSVNDFAIYIKSKGYSIETMPSSSTRRARKVYKDEPTNTGLSPE